MLRNLMVIVFLCLPQIFCFNFNIDDVTVIVDPTGANDTYFSYSLLLQKGQGQEQQSVVIVGAPKQKITDMGGSVYRCPVSNKTPCEKYNIQAESKFTFTGNFLGLSLDGADTYGGPFVVCAPRISHGYKLDGSCFEKLKSNNLDFSIKIIDPVQGYFRGGYTGLAFSEVGIDVHYDTDTNVVVMGAPGSRTWTGNLVTSKSNSDGEYKSFTFVPKEDTHTIVENENQFIYRGYTVSVGKFDKSGRTFYIMGAPRADLLKGKVSVFVETDLISPWKTFAGNDTGGGFGSALLACDVTGDGVDDLFVGAPTSRGATHDEGYAEFYEIGPNGVKNRFKLYGNKKIGARFGSSMMPLGDTDRDGSKDVAISAPYEDEGVGAVYIYRGSFSGPKFSQRLSPLEMKWNKPVRGFGLGLSRGVDIDGNGHNDLAVGAYQTSQVFVVRSKTIINCQLYLFANVSGIIGETAGFGLQYCVEIFQRYEGPTVGPVPLRFHVQMGYGSKFRRNFTRYLTAKPYVKECGQEEIMLPESVRTFQNTSFEITMKGQIVNRTDVMTQSSLFESHSIPYLHGCGGDNVCITNFNVFSNSSVNEVILGKTKDLPITVYVENIGEPAYDTKLHIEFPAILELRNIRDCSRESNVYICPIYSLVGNKVIEYTFDISTEKWAQSENKTISLHVKVTSIGKNVGNGDKTSIHVPVILQNNLFVIGKSVPETPQFNKTDKEGILKMNHIFSVSNQGPSPVKLDVIILVPNVKAKGTNIFEILSAKATVNGIATQCIQTNATWNKEPKKHTSPVVLTPRNRTEHISCFNTECSELFCRAGYLYKSSEPAVFEISLGAKSGLLGEKFKEYFQHGKDILAFTTTAYLQNSTQTIEEFSTTIIFGSSASVSNIPLWIYLVGILLGLLILLLISSLLYKLHFFERVYKDKLEQEKILNTDTMDAAAGSSLTTIDLLSPNGSGELNPPIVDDPDNLDDAFEKEK